MQTSNHKIKFGIVGCGMIAHVHAKAIGDICTAELVGVADNSYDFALKFAQKWGVRAFNDYNELLSDKEIDVVCVCTPSCFHAQNAIDALNSGKHVVLEKPMAITVEDTDKIIETCAKTGNLLTVISQLRFSKDIIKIKKLIEEGAFGKITLCELNMKYYRDPEYYSSSPWKGTLKFDGGGALMNQGIHGIDLLEFVMGEITSVNGKAKTLYHDIEVEDTAVAIVEFASGALGTIIASSCAYPGFDRKITISGSDGYAILRENKIEKMQIKGEVFEGDCSNTSAGANDPTKVNSDFHKLQFENLLSAIKGEAKLLIDCHEGKKAVKIIKSIYNS